MAVRKKLGEILVESGLLDEHQLQSALGHQRQWGGKLGEVLVNQRFASEDAIAECLAAQLGLPRMDLYVSGVEARASRLLPVEMAEAYEMIPVKIEGLDGERGAFVWIATADPTNIAALDEIQFRTGKPVRPVVVTATQVRAALRHAYHGEPLAPPETFGVGEAPKGGAASTSEWLEPEAEKELREVDIVHEEGTPIEQIGPAAPPAREEGIDDHLEMLGFSSGRAGPGSSQGKPPEVAKGSASFSITSEEQDAVLASKDAAGTARPPESKPGRPTPEQVVSAVVRLLVRKGLIAQDELMNELRRK